MTHLIVHYHLRPGGVTSVALLQAEALYSQGKTVVLVSGTALVNTSCPHHFLPELDYANQTYVSSEWLFEALMALAKSYPGPIVWHMHNPLLGCHPTFTNCVKRLAEANERMILHLHDFAEDERPSNYAQLIHKEKLYPRAPQIHYLVLTQRDREIVERAGLPQREVTVLPNPVMAQAVDRAGDATQVLYPARGIDRKNLGEFLLLAALAPEGTNFVSSLGPGASKFAQNYDFWSQCVRELSLSVTLAKGEEQSISREQLIAESSHIVSSSVKEGFGLLFVESIAWRRPLFGRALPHVRDDLLRYGIDHPHLYDRIGCGDDDFASLGLAEKKQCILAAKNDPHKFWIERKGEKSSASIWLREVLEIRECSLDLSCLEPFSPQRHAATIAKLAEHLATVEISKVTFLDADIVSAAFR